MVVMLEVFPQRENSISLDPGLHSWTKVVPSQDGKAIKSVSKALLLRVFSVFSSNVVHKVLP